MRQELEATFSRQQLSEVSYIAERIDNAVRLRFDSLALIANSITPQMMASRQLASSFLSERKAIFNQCKLGVFVISKDGQGIADYPQAEGRSKADFTQRDFYRQVMATGKPTISKPGYGVCQRPAPDYCCTGLRQETNRGGVCLRKQPERQQPDQHPRL